MICLRAMQGSGGNKTTDPNTVTLTDCRPCCGGKTLTKDLGEASLLQGFVVRRGQPQDLTVIMTQINGNARCTQRDALHDILHMGELGFRGPHNAAACRGITKQLFDDHAGSWRVSRWSHAAFSVGIDFNTRTLFCTGLAADELQT